jgi:hypothetical protein
VWGAIKNGAYEGALGAGAGFLLGGGIALGGVYLAMGARTIGIYLLPSTSIYALGSLAMIGGMGMSVAEFRFANDNYERAAAGTNFIISFIGARLSLRAMWRSMPRSRSAINFSEEVVIKDPKWFNLFTDSVRENLIAEKIRFNEAPRSHAYLTGRAELYFIRFLFDIFGKIGILGS